MNILYIAEDISLPDFHGGSTHVQETINALKEIGHNVFVICKINKGQKTKEKIKEVIYYRIRLPKSGLHKNIFLFLNLGKIIEGILQENKIDLIWQRNRIFGNHGIIIGKQLGKKTILEMNEPIESSEANILFTLIKKWFYYSTKFADIVTGTHNCMLRGIPKRKQLSIYYGSNPKLFNPKRTDKNISKKFGLMGKTIFYSGSFQEWHCIKNAIIAFESLQKEIPNAAFILAGDGKQKKELEEFVKKNRIKKIFFVGNIALEKLAYYINASDVCIALFDRNYKQIKKYGYYYSPIKIHDYKACGKPVIASDIGNLKELIKGEKNGFLVNESNKKEIIAVMKKAFGKKNKKKIESNNLKETKTKYNWINVTKKVLGAIK